MHPEGPTNRVAVAPHRFYAGKGRAKTVPDAEIRQRHAAGEGPAAIARHLGISRTSVYHALGKKNWVSP